MDLAELGSSVDSSGLVAAAEAKQARKDIP